MSSNPTPSPPLSSTTSPSPSPSHNHHLTNSDHQKLPPPAIPDPPAVAPPPRTTVFPSREDCWSEDATRTLIDAWGSHYLELNRGNLRQNHWQAVADTVNALHATTPKLRRTDVQCKNRIDTVKKRYKIEKSKLVQSSGRYVSTWTHFHTLETLIGGTLPKSNNHNISNGHTRNLRRRPSPSPEPTPEPSPEPSPPYRRKSEVIRKDLMFPTPSPRIPWSVPVGPRSKRSGPASMTERNFSVMAAAAAALEAQEVDYDDDDEEYPTEWGTGLVAPAAGKKRKRGMEEQGNGVGQVAEGYRRLAEAISRLGAIYQRVEESKQTQMVELEKQRMQFAKDLEIQRMKVFMESQVQIEKLKRSKWSSGNNSYL